MAAARAGVDFLGFVFAPSKRQVTAEEAAAIIETLPEHVQTVGVFVNETVENIITIAEHVKLDYIQLHGDETPEFCKHIPFPVIKAFSIETEHDIRQMEQYDCAYYLVDSPGVDYRGGSGIPFDWNVLENMNLSKGQLILAGGLNVDNITDAINKVHPAGVDVSSGVETNGEKDIEKITAFIQKAKKEERGLNDNLHIT